MAEDQASLADTAEAVRYLRMELVAERKNVLEPLLRRMSDLAEALSRGEQVPSAVIEEGLDLWQTYVSRLHDVHVGQFAAVRSSMPHTEACTLPLLQLEQDPARAELRINEMRTILMGYLGRPKLYGALLGPALLGNARSELAWENFEEDFATSCLPDHLTSTALRHWSTALSETRAAAEATRLKVEDYLKRTAEYDVSARSPTSPSARSVGAIAAR